MSLGPESITQQPVRTRSAGSESYLATIARRLIKHKLAMIGIVLVVLLLLFCYVGPYFSPYDYTRSSLFNRFQSPSRDAHWMGTDELGRDVLTRVMMGGRVSLAVGFLVALSSVVVGGSIGALSGYLGGWVDHVIMRFVDFMLSIPLLPILMITAYVLGPNFRNMVFVLVAFGWMGICRIVRGQVLSIKQQEFVEGARAIGCSDVRIIFKHVLPNSIAPIIVSATLGIGGAILSESYLSYLGLGVQLPTPSWGNMLMGARQYLSTAPWLAIWPGVFIFLTLLAFNFIGDGLRDALDPKLHNRR